MIPFAAVRGAEAAIAIASFVVTFALHSTCSSAIALGAAKWLVRTARSRDVVWKASLALAPCSTIWMTVTRQREWLVSLFQHPEHVFIERQMERFDGRPPLDHVSVTSAGVLALAWAVVATVLMLLVVGVAVQVWRMRALRAALRTRRAIGSNELSAATQRELGASGQLVRVTVAEGLVSPLARGLHEICLPEHELAKLTEAQQRSVVVHELAHLKRRDPIWFAAADALASFVLLLPLSRVVARALRRDAEFLCDDVAVERLRSGRSLVEALALIGGPADGFRTRGPLALSNAAPIVARAERALRAPERHDRRDHVATIVALALLAAVVLVLPALRPAPPTLPAMSLRSGGTRLVVDTAVTVRALRH